MKLSDIKKYICLHKAFTKQLTIEKERHYIRDTADFRQIRSVALMGLAVWMEGREGGREGGKKDGRKEGRERRRMEGMEGGREEGWKEGREGRRMEGREGGKEDGRKGGKEEG